MYQPYPGGSSIEIGFDDQWITVHLPPVGMVPDWYNYDNQAGTYKGKPCDRPPLIKSDILFDELPVKDQKWKRTGLPADYKAWTQEERRMQTKDPNWTHPEKDIYIEEQWKKRMNGVWIAMGNRSGKLTEYHYLTGFSWFFYEWWRNDFGYANFRTTLQDIFYGLKWTEEHPEFCGLTVSTNRRSGKTAILGCYEYEYTSRTPNSYSGLQAQTDEDAGKKFKLNVVQPFKKLPDFWRPVYNTRSSLTTKIEFQEATKTSVKANKEWDPDMDESLYSILDYRACIATKYDGEKLHRYCMEEPGKWEDESVLYTWEVVRPCLYEGMYVIGNAYLPTTIEELDKGGDEFIELFEGSFYSKSLNNANGKTDTHLLALFISADRNYIFDEYGRAIVEDPKPGEVIYDEKGKKIEKGARSMLLADRLPLRNKPERLAALKRKYPLTWVEAKMTGQDKCLFNAEALNERLHEIHMMAKKPYTRGNFEWVNGVDGDVEFVRDEHAGRWLVSWLPDAKDAAGKKVINNVGFDIVPDQNMVNKKVWYPKNDRDFCAGTDPIKYVKTDDPRASKAAAYIKRKKKFTVIKKDKDGRVIDMPDVLREIDRLFDNNFVAEYLHRPDEPSVYGEDMIKACRFYGCSILPEDNVQALRQHFIARGYEPFIIYQDDLNNIIFDKNRQDDKPVDSVPSVVNDYITKLIQWVNKNYYRIMFPRLIEQLLKFTIADRTRFDAVVGAGYTLMAEDRIVMEEDRVDNIDEWFDEFENSGNFGTYAKEEQETETDIYDLF